MTREYVVTRDELKLMQNYPLWIKVEKTKQRIREFYEHYNGDVYIGFSGGKDSTVLLHIARQVYPDIEAVYCDTGLEYPELREFVKKQENVTWLKPDMTFKRVVNEKGYPLISKAVSNTVRLAKQNIKDGKNTLRVRQIRGEEVGSRFNKGKWQFLLEAPFDVSEQCCDELKKKPFKKFEKESGKHPIMGTMADEGMQRMEAYCMTGCNSFKGRAKSQPLGFWTEQDIYKYLLENNLEIAEVYGEIIEENGKYKTTGVHRTGCMFCGFGVHLEKHPNRFEQMKITHPKQYDYCINTLGLGEILDYINVKY